MLLADSVSPPQQLKAFIDPKVRLSRAISGCWVPQQFDRITYARHSIDMGSHSNSEGASSVVGTEDDAKSANGASPVSRRASVESVESCVSCDLVFSREPSDGDGQPIVSRVSTRPPSISVTSKTGHLPPPPIHLSPSSLPPIVTYTLESPSPKMEAAELSSTFLGQPTKRSGTGTLSPADEENSMFKSYMKGVQFRHARSMRDVLESAQARSRNLTSFSLCGRPRECIQ
jgi:hypothetical protein